MFQYSQKKVKKCLSWSFVVFHMPPWRGRNGWVPHSEISSVAPWCWHHGWVQEWQCWIYGRLHLHNSLMIYLMLNVLLLLLFFPQQKINLEFYIDIHAHSTMMNGFMYGNIFEDEERFQRQAVFPKLLCQNAEDFSYVSQVFLNYFFPRVFCLFVCLPL